MKWLTFLFFVAQVLIAFEVFGATATPGGYNDVAVTEKAVVDAAQFAVEAKALKMSEEEKSTPNQMELREILSAQQQVVSGVNYKLTIEVSVDGTEKIAEAVVWWQDWREPDPYLLTSWNWMETTIQK